LRLRRRWNGLKLAEDIVYGDKNRKRSLGSQPYLGRPVSASGHADGMADHISKSIRGTAAESIGVAAGLDHFAYLQKPASPHLPI
jgi:hypothetical protein